MTLHWGAEAIAKCLPPDLLDALNEGICCDPFYTGTDMYYIPNYNGESGEKIFNMPGNAPRRVSRRKLRNFLSQGLDIQVRRAFSEYAASTDCTSTVRGYPLYLQVQKSP
jgi:hypothetical protein